LVSNEIKIISLISTIFLGHNHFRLTQTKLFILFENLFKLRQRRLAVCMVTDFVSFIYNLKNMF
ncbi:hypothetical protein RLH78_03870, partial [Streptococcus pneumoniae]|nr:hypothetical protein [Streptococcus pneumoniae]MDS8285300.1 hypothetical protein [Streptococcus pneumoniae]MDS9032170.1 hypothetical protein [Streptococcus pneumoniae]